MRLFSCRVLVAYVYFFASQHPAKVEHCFLRSSAKFELQADKTGSNLRWCAIGSRTTGASETMLHATWDLTLHAAFPQGAGLITRALTLRRRSDLPYQLQGPALLRPSLLWITIRQTSSSHFQKKKKKKKKKRSKTSGWCSPNCVPQTDPLSQTWCQLSAAGSK
ncbi:hypothetical protein FN846DRAFT_334925 [Sphaerosporella brunnea]|uniref:Uncharacterized protein n=1 Tax=Sphaerosporella brunnea TaxID=1250544 RepID=A0A5J5EKA1_9PEZI|nr:hypothetical protein FN846DRAFT_334925 [Sphaerosporella brunnea]